IYSPGSKILYGTLAYKKTSVHPRRSGATMTQVHISVAQRPDGCNG
uniref:Uncharacterized protein n=1 Tax=Anopheles minimus TaxID=112268 RepID=A0A182WMT1_9DIPT